MFGNLKEKAFIQEQKILLCTFNFVLMRIYTNLKAHGESPNPARYLFETLGIFFDYNVPFKNGHKFFVMKQELKEKPQESIENYKRDAEFPDAELGKRCSNISRTFS